MKLTTFSLAALLASTACATANLTPAASVERLEREQRSAPRSAQVNRSLGIAYYKAGRYPDARAALDRASALDPRDGITQLYLGLTAEEQEDLATAKLAYSSYLQYGRTSRVRSQLQARLAALARKEIVADARVVLRQESQLGTPASSPRTVAVLPMRFTGSDSSLKPLERGFTDLLITDLSQSSQLTLVERERIQALLDEMTLQRSGATDASTNVRAGRLVRAGRVVQGSLLQAAGNQLRVDAAVVDVPTARVDGSVQGTNVLDEIFALEKQMALDLFSQLGVTLTVAERNAVEQRPTRSLAAFLAYSRGLTAEDAGRYDDANRYFDEAVRLDPGFGAAQQKGEEVRAASAGATVSAATVEVSLRGTSEGTVVNAATQGSSGTAGVGGTTLGSTAKAAAGDLNPSAAGAATGATGGAGGNTPAKDPAAAATGSDNVGAAKVSIVIVRPKVP